MRKNHGELAFEEPDPWIAARVVLEIAPAEILHLVETRSNIRIAWRWMPARVGERRADWPAG